ncbi:hypothetical protein D3C72_2337400 [compost metagenome]
MNLPDAFLHAPVDDGVEAFQVGAFVIARPALGHLLPQVCLLWFGEQPLGQPLADGFDSEHARQAPAFEPP